MTRQAGPTRTTARIPARRPVQTPAQGLDLPSRARGHNWRRLDINVDALLASFARRNAAPPPRRTAAAEPVQAAAAAEPVQVGDVVEPVPATADAAEPVVEILDNVNNNRHEALVALPDREFEILDPRVRQIANIWIHIISEQIAQAIVYILLSTVMGHLGFFGGYKRKTKKLRNKINKRKTKNKKKNKVNRRKTKNKKNKVNKRKTRR